MIRPTETLHATLLVQRDRGLWRGVLLRGPSGAGKSDLALRLLGHGWRLVSDDRTIVWRDGAKLFGRAPQSLSGLIEARGVGVVASPWAIAAFGEVVLLADCVGRDDEVERTPLRQTIRVQDIDIPATRLCALDASAAHKLMLAFALA